MTGRLGERIAVRSTGIENGPVLKGGDSLVRRYRNFPDDFKWIFLGAAVAAVTMRVCGFTHWNWMGVIFHTGGSILIALPLIMAYETVREKLTGRVARRKETSHE